MGGGFFSEQHQMWLHEKYAGESFAVDAKLIWAFILGVGWVFISQQVKRTYCVSEHLDKYKKKILLVGAEGKHPRYATKQSREEVSLLG